MVWSHERIQIEVLDVGQEPAYNNLVTNMKEQ
jgi:hypothetical protein